MGDLRAILLAPDMQYPSIRSDFGPQIQCFDTQNNCVMFIQNHMLTSRRIDLFLSSADRNIIGTSLPLFDKIHFHLYCPTIDDIPIYEALFSQRAYVEIFEADYLWVQIGYTLLGYDNIRIRESNNSNEALAAWTRTHTILLEEVKAMQAGVQPE